MTPWVAMHLRDTIAAAGEAVAAASPQMAGHVREAAEEARSRRAGCTRSDQLALAEACRRAERAVGLTLRAAQEAGQVRRQHADTHRDLPSPAQAAGIAHRSVIARCYLMADGVSDDDFELAVAQARDDGCMSREHLTGILAGGDRQVPDPLDYSSAAAAQRLVVIGEMAAAASTSRQIAATLGVTDEAVRRAARGHGIAIRADQVVTRTRKPPDPVKVGTEAVIALEGLATAVSGLDLSRLVREQASEWAASLTASLRVLSRFSADVKAAAR